MAWWLKLVGLVFTGVVLLGPVGVVQGEYRAQISDATTVAQQPMALVLGASVYAGVPSPVLQDRLDAAQELYGARRVSKIIVSGDNRAVDYNEPTVMKKYLVAHGVPDTDVIEDFAGRRTYDSCYRLKEIFGQSSAIVVTQSFHLPRALYLCNSLGVKAAGVSADRRSYADMPELYLREMAGSWLAWWDVSIGHPLPVLGERVEVF